jgi:hypothetical protein
MPKRTGWLTAAADFIRSPEKIETEKAHVT